MPGDRTAGVVEHCCGGHMRRLGLTSILATLACFAVPAVVAAQSAIAGVVRDSTGAALPGVTVEASSAALIEKVRTAQTDGQGRYEIVDLRPGVYTVTFSLQSFTTVKREGIELPAAFTATVGAELRGGDLAETVTLSGARPSVDSQSTARQSVMSREVLDTLPT